jgi:hypothetical protein
MKMKIAFLVAAFASAVSFESCSLNSGASAPASAFLIANFCPNTAIPVDIYANGSFILGDVAYTNYTNYTGVPSGTYDFIFTVTGNSQGLANVNYSFQPNTSYSLFAIDTISNGVLQTALVQDILSVPAGDSAKIRFLDFAPDAGAVDIALPSGGAVLNSGRYFNDQASIPAYANFTSVPAGKYVFEIRKSGTSNVILPAVTDSLVAGRIYTIALSGLVTPGPNEAPLSASLMNNPTQ